jgi:hypothetical protein
MSAGPWRLPAPPDDRPTFLAHAMTLSALHGTQPWPGGGYPLPDADPTRRRPFLSGAVADGVQTHHGGIESDQTTTDAVVHLVQTLVTGKPAATDLGRLHDLLAGQSALSIADSLTTAVRERNLPTDRVHAVGRWLAEHGSRRHAVAAGLVLTGATGDDRDRDLLLLLGSLEDLTLYAAVALRRCHTDPDRAIFELAKRVGGWGRIHAVERLKGTGDPEIKAWLLRDGFRNGVMNEYLAHLAATTGDLHGALTAPDVDDPLLDGAGDILDALCAVGGPAKDITDYPYGPATIQRYLTLVGQRPPTLDRVASVLRVGRFIAADSAARLSWRDADRGRLGQVAADLPARPVWRAVVDRALDDPDIGMFRRAIWPARRLGIPARDRIRARLRAAPDDAYLWQSLTDDIDDVLALAGELLPLDDLATGPTTEVGIGGPQADHILDFIVSRLDRHPGKGWPMVRIGLRNRTVRNRNMAIRTLSAWPADQIPPDAAHVVRDALAAEPDPQIARAMQRLLDKWLCR